MDSADISCTCPCGEPCTVDHAMICTRGGFVIQRHNKLLDLESRAPEHGLQRSSY